MISAQDLVEKILAKATSDDCIVLVTPPDAIDDPDAIKAMTVTDLVAITPLVVRVLLAQRRLA